MKKSRKCTLKFVRYLETNAFYYNIVIYAEFSLIYLIKLLYNQPRNDFKLKIARQDDAAPSDECVRFQTSLTMR